MSHPSRIVICCDHGSSAPDVTDISELIVGTPAGIDYDAAAPGPVTTTMAALRPAGVRLCDPFQYHTAVRTDCDPKRRVTA